MTKHSRSVHMWNKITFELFYILQNYTQTPCTGGIDPHEPSHSATAHEDLCLLLRTTVPARSPQLSSPQLSFLGRLLSLSEDKNKTPLQQETTQNTGQTDRQDRTEWQTQCTRQGCPYIIVCPCNTSTYRISEDLTWQKHKTTNWHTINYLSPCPGAQSAFHIHSSCSNLFYITTTLYTSHKKMSSIVSHVARTTGGKKIMFVFFWVKVKNSYDYHNLPKKNHKLWKIHVWV